MSATTCDLCGYGGTFSMAQDFQRFGEIDLCHWCADDSNKTSVACGRHVVTFTQGSWECSCGERYAHPFFLSERLRAAVPNMLNATANNHVQS